MDSPQRIIPIKEEQPQLLSPCGSRKRRLGGGSTTDSANSPEFEFWMLRNPSFPQPNLLSADELFVDGVLLPLHHLNLNNTTTTTTSNPDDPPDEAPEPSNPPPEPEPEPETGPQITAQPTASTASKRWKDIFGKKTAASSSSASTSKDKDRDRDKEKKREKKSSNAAAATPHGPTAELNINIWPFSRSRSAGNSASRPKMASAAPAPRKVSSAPCSRSNSAGESKSRKWPSSPGRPGVHLGRSSPVWQVRRGATKATTATGSNIAINNHHSEAVVRSGEKGAGKKDVTETTRHGKNTIAAAGGGGKAKGLNLNVPTCIGYRNHLSCRSHENSAVAVGRSATNGGKLGVGGGNSTANGGNGASLFNLRSLFTKKVY
ncbi:hypothetical protein Tsubulata_013367 [Turnera subulata]|uniref:Uncharacterized protein n=1 Tax=Turnera subulata TaxID=218843 RepID=A0A9Q0JIU6_9ROSI|nr:hypothetical protein Tsubulata_013367 [Turnera subulata]